MNVATHVTITKHVLQTNKEMKASASQAQADPFEGNRFSFSVKPKFLFQSCCI